jgi:predicted DNA-binding transcriptional regulator YafY
MRASRLVSILMVLQTRGRVTARALADRLEVSTRTVYRDIDELCAAGVPVVVERGATGGFELLEGWRTTLTGMTPHEAQSLFLAGLPGPAMELGLADTMASAQLKLLAALPSEWQEEVRHVSRRFHVDLAGWYRRTTPVRHLRALADAVWADRWIAIGYESWEGASDRSLEPLGLVVKAGEWYLVARSHESRRHDAAPRTYRVSNIRTLTVHGGFSRPKSFDLSAHWAESTRRFEREIHRASARVLLTERGRKLLRDASAAVADAIDTETSAPLASGERLEVTIPIESIEHAVGQLLALGTDVEVLDPPALRKALRDAAGAVTAIYAPPTGRGARAGSARPRPRGSAARSRSA